MNETDTPVESDIIEVPLWELLLSTNDFTPGCGCEWEFFDMTLKRVNEWVIKNDHKKAL